ncbi:MAG: cytochrome-c peroxidase [Deltaproteobacteria bacterium]|nr:MAG: cytochrome-c peroxidase [Deltaproteobacteria bacterium]
MPLAVLAACLLAPATTGCAGDEAAVDRERLRARILEAGVPLDPTVGRPIASIEDPVAQLGRDLFFTKALGGDYDTACASCHHPVLGGGDGLSLSIGVHALHPDVLGPGRVHRPGWPGYDGGPTVPRNAPTTFNLALWDRVLFHDGRVESLGKHEGAHGIGPEGIRTPDVPFGSADPNAGLTLAAAQARFPVTSPEEMRGFDFEAGADREAARVHLACRIGDYGIGADELGNPRWESRFRAAFDLPTAPVEEVVDFAHVAEAIARYESSQIFVDSPFHRFVRGDDDALTEAEARGAWLFFTPRSEGGAGCADCHDGPLLSDESFHVLAVPQIGRGKGDGLDGRHDFGRARETGIGADQFAFRTPSLLNVAVTGPYGHDGAYESLEAMVRHHLDPAAALATYEDELPTQPGIQTDGWRARTETILERVEVFPLELSDDEVDDLLAFLEALTDPCVTDRACLAPWIPDPEAPDPDGFRLVALDADGEPL